MLSDKFKKFKYTAWSICIVAVGGVVATLSVLAQPGAQDGQPDVAKTLMDGAGTGITEVAPEVASDPSESIQGTPAPKTVPKKSNSLAEMLDSLRTKEITIDGPRLTINLPKRGGVARVTISSGQVEAPISQMIKKLKFKKVHLKNGTFVIRTSSGFTQTIYAVDATITGDKGTSIRRAKGRFKFRGEDISFEITTAKPSDDKGSAILPVNVLLDGDKINAQLDGRINLVDGLEIKGKLKLVLSDLKFISAWLGYPLSSDSKTAKLDADGEFSWRIFKFFEFIRQQGSLAPGPE